MEFILKNKKLIIWIVVIIIILFLINKYWAQVKHLFQSRSVTTIEGLSNKLTSERESKIQGIAQRLYNDIYNTNIFTGHDESICSETLGLSDSEIIYLAKFYQQSISRGNSLYADLQNEYYIYGSDCNKIKTRLTKVGQQ